MEPKIFPSIFYWMKWLNKLMKFIVSTSMDEQRWYFVWFVLSPDFHSSLDECFCFVFFFVLFVCVHMKNLIRHRSKTISRHPIDFSHSHARPLYGVLHVCVCVIKKNNNNRKSTGDIWTAKKRATKLSI